MSSKRLEAILGSVPSATAKGEFLNAELISKKQTAKPPAPIEYTRIVATIPQQLKDEIRQYIKANKGDTETTLILKSLKKMGFNVDPSWIVDKRSIR
ncbi:MAG: hypothetical protein FJX70_05020 [Alphaproteobacteria bacterium]|jgi:hypothetical protein|nr:hypothetical protein [Alphaproteobacteria bacterium]